MIPIVDTSEDAFEDDAIRQFNAQSIVLLRGFNTRQFRDLMTAIGPIYEHPHANENGITEIRPNNVEANERGFTRSELSAHTDRSFIDQPPGVLGMLCIQAASTGGEARLVDFKAVSSKLAADGMSPELISDRLHLESADGKRRSVLRLNSRNEYEVRYRDDDSAKPQGNLEMVAAVRREITSNQLTLPLRTGDGYIISNHRWLHGREAFEGSRLAARILVSGTRDLESTLAFSLERQYGAP